MNEASRATMAKMAGTLSNLTIREGTWQDAVTAAKHFQANPVEGETFAVGFLYMIKTGEEMLINALSLEAPNVVLLMEYCDPALRSRHITIQDMGKELRRQGGTNVVIYVMSQKSVEIVEELETGMRRPRPEPEIEIRIASTRPHVGKTVAAELIRRALSEAGFLDVSVISAEPAPVGLTEAREVTVRGSQAINTRIRVIDHNDIVAPSAKRKEVK